MLFNSLDFFKFFGVVFTLYVVLTHKWQNRLLLGASLFFYAYWDWRFVFLIAFSIIFTHLFALRIGRESALQKKKFFLTWAIGIHLALLFFFKYVAFLLTTTAHGLGLLGVITETPNIHIVLPLGISFYTFQAISYLVDVYNGDLKPCESLAELSLFKLYFPQLIAGPIERGSHLLPQLRKPREITWLNLQSGLYLFAAGLFKKVAIADNVGVITNKVFAHPESFSASEVWVGALAFTLQIYCDFSGYSDMAKGLARTMGIDLIQNFKAPFLASNPADYWNRWHISLSGWFRDYIYYPLFAKAKSVELSVLITFFLNGVWHGAGWNFLALGLYWGLVVSVYMNIRPHLRSASTNQSPQTQRIVKLTSVFLMFHFTCFGFLIFRAEGGHSLIHMLSKLSAGSWTWTPFLSESALVLAFFYALILTFQIPRRFQEKPDWLISKSPLFQFSFATSFVYLFLILLLFGRNTLEMANDFIYFQF